ncbi:uncharacterized protein EHS24_004404 [Apiotrichum porosum]|uniref:Protein arginine methyltransferase NDUFAF7 n=1 Tax=Apiotrichum porosum TaxID=105984 RepID=A0A427Y509_9TREE|nr:uncharacterized protein EHS24_004404 [Apiotrichum porosum]RSH86173.1 hypothetical protein EHS24_004404 [Apiotrichum porosum]
MAASRLALATLGRTVPIRGLSHVLCDNAAIPNRTLFSPSAARLVSTAATPSPGSIHPSLAQIIEDSISATGPMPVARYMQMCLTHPTLGYYSQGDVFGKQGDFITSPEISQIFGELVAIWLLTRWMAAGSPAECRIIELGPGRGTLMDDVLRSFQQVQIKSIHLVENSMNMRKLQKDKLSVRAELLGAELCWEDDIDGVPKSDVYTMAIAHEFFDALPVHILQRMGLEKFALTAIRHTGNAKFTLALDRDSSMLSSLLPAASSRYSTLPIGSRMEISPDSSRIVRGLGETMAAGGAGLVIDYGGNRSFSNSFRHKIVDIFDQPGSSDLTANVDFAYLKESLKDVAVGAGPISQSTFLTSMGLEPRLSKLLAQAESREKQQRLQKGADRLIDKNGMGDQYQVMAILNGAGAQGDVYPFGTVVAPSNAAVVTPK